MKKNLIIIFNVIFGLVLIPACMTAMTSPLIIETQRSIKPPNPWEAFGSLIIFPVLIIFSIISSILFLVYEKPNPALVMSGIAFLNIILLLGALFQLE
ncbi:MAG: hypothetical protein P1V18_04825 [Candidatus Gracilibacteria bacterium]|nr:hypothetical protein [Candidatus Gracilibacteria bacterium]